MVTVPRVITNKTVLTGLTHTSLKGASIFPPVKAKLDKFSHPAAASAAVSAKIKSFTMDLKTTPSNMPKGLSNPYYVPNYSLNYKGIRI